MPALAAKKGGAFPTRGPLDSCSKLEYPISSSLHSPEQLPNLLNSFATCPGIFVRNMFLHHRADNDLCSPIHARRFLIMQTWPRTTFVSLPLHSMVWLTRAAHSCTSRTKARHWHTCSLTTDCGLDHVCTGIVSHKFVAGRLVRTSKTEGYT